MNIGTSEIGRRAAAIGFAAVEDIWQEDASQILGRK
jgi:hypothetical protein